MAPSATPQDGETFVAGRSATKARTLLAAADKLGVDSALIRTTGFGYIVPDEVAQADADVEDIDAPADTDSLASDVPDHKDETEVGSEPHNAEPGTGPKTVLEAENTGEFDPSAHTVEEVNTYLDSADAAESERVLEAEANGKARKGILPDTEGE